MELEINEKKLNDLKNEVRSFEGEDSGFMTPEPPKEKKSRGRPKLSEAEKQKRREEQKQKALGVGVDKEQNQQSQAFAIPTQMITGPLAKGISTLGENYVGHPAARMLPQEEEAVAAALGLVLDKYMPDMASKYGPELVLVLTLSQYGIRLAALKKVIALEKSKNEPKKEEKPENRQFENKLEDFVSDEKDFKKEN